MCPKQLCASSPARQRGSALMVAVFVLLLGGLLLAALAKLGVFSSTALIYEVQGQRSYWLARSQLELGFAQLFPLKTNAASSGVASCAAVNQTLQNWNDAGWPGCSSQLSCEEKTVDGKAWFLLRSTGQCGEGTLTTSRVLVAEVSQ